jgi:glucose/arabinose dehydrogenase
MFQAACLFGEAVMTRSIGFLSGIVLMMLLCSSPLLTRAYSQVEPGVIQVALEPIVSGLISPIYVAGARDGSNRLFIVEQGGRIKVLQPGAATPSVFLDITARVLSGGERGLLGLAFHPDFENNRRFFVNYTRRSDGATVIAEYRVSESDPNLADTSETVLLLIPQPFANHNGGMIEFGPDGFLYIGMGDGGSANDPGNRAQDLNNLLGKILRIDVDHANGAIPYSSPADNPFFGAAAGRDEVYAYGVRNPWRFSFDRLTGELYAGDVGQNAWEEIDVITRGGNYGWRMAEGNHCNPSIGGGSCSLIGLVAPIAEYLHSGGRCSITGGYVYRGAKQTLPSGTYVYADFCSGEIFTFAGGGGQGVLLATGMNISSFGEDEAGEIYVVGLSGTIHRLINPNPPPPSTLSILSAGVRRRSNQEILQPITVKNNGKKFEVFIVGAGYVEASVILVNGRELNSELQETATNTKVLVGRLRRFMLVDPVTLVVEFVNPDGARSNQVALQVVPEAN